MRGRPRQPMTLLTEMHNQLESMVRSPSLPQGLARRAKIVLLAADGVSNKEIAEQLGLSRQTVGLWRKRFIEQSLLGLYDELRPGAPRSIKDEQIQTLIRKTLESKPKDSTH